MRIKTRKPPAQTTRNPGDVSVVYSCSRKQSSSRSIELQQWFVLHVLAIYPLAKFLRTNTAENERAKPESDKATNISPKNKTPPQKAKASWRNSKTGWLTRTPPANLQ